MSAFEPETVTEVHHWTDRLFSFKTTRHLSLRFKSGQFVMIGLEVDGKNLMRAYSVASAHYADHLEFFSIKVPDGPLTSILQHLKVGDKVIVGQKPVGTLLLDNLTPAKHLYFFATGTGLAPFLSLIRDPDAYERYEKIVLVHGVREKAELAYQELIEKQLPQDEFLGEYVREKLIYYPTVTREAFLHQGRIPDLIRSGQLAADIGLPPINAIDDRAMICGNPGLVKDLPALLKEMGLSEGSSSRPAEFVIERAFVEK